MRFTVIGCDNSVLIHTAILIESGAEVALLKTSSIYNDDFFKVIKKGGGYNVKDETNGGNRFLVKPSFITRDV